MKRLLLAVVLAVVAVAAWAQWPNSPLPPTAHADKVVVRKSARVLELYQGTQLLRTYRVSLGPHPAGHKQQESDGRTPEGRYLLDYRNPHSSFHLALHISYPAPADVANAKQHRLNPGGLIMVHGLHDGLGWLGRLHRFYDWTDGCVAVTDREIEEIWRAVPDKTPIVIEP